MTSHETLCANFYRAASLPQAMQAYVGERMVERCRSEGHKPGLPSMHHVTGDARKSILRAIAKHGALSRGNLRKFTAISGDNISAHLWHLTDIGVLKRFGNSKKFLYNLTDKGRAEVGR